MDISTDIWIWVGAFLTLSIFSFLYKDNPFYKLAEHLFVGVSAAYWMCMGIWGTLVPNLIAKLHPPLVKNILPAVADKPAEYKYLIPLILGIMFLMRLAPKGAWISRWALAFIVGTTAGLNLTRYLRSDFVGQIQYSIIPLVTYTEGSFNFVGTFSNIIIFLGVFCGLIYFFFSREHKGAFGVASRVGIYILMITFGAGFGYTVMARISLLVGRMQFIFSDWLGIISR
ncbi:MAG: hypothetical protein GY855_05085 [candidate division Zixibacteria bacterium]|nr:hypothetical protein [candidate division Zixibacteria bacterium]